MPDSPEPILKTHFRVRSFDIDLNQKVRLSHLCEYFQEIAGKHAEQLGVGFDKMQKSGLVWMLSRLYIRIQEYPSWEEDIAVETWPCGIERLFYRRDFHVYRNNKSIISAVSYWLAIHLETLRPRIIPFNEKVLKHNAGRYAFSGNMEKITISSGGKTRSHEIRYSELDQNKHVNNTKYMDWIMDAFESRTLEHALPRFIGIEYKHQAKEHDVVQIRYTQDPECNQAELFEGTLNADQKVCFRAKVGF